MGDVYGTEWSKILPWILLARRTSFHEDLGTTPATMLFGEDPPLPGDMVPLHNGDTLQNILDKVKANVDRPKPQTSLNRNPKVYQPKSMQTCTHVYTKVPKPTPLGPKWLGPYPILKRLGDSSLQIQTGHFVNGKPRSEVRHWNTCHPYTPNDTIPDAERPRLGRKPLNRAAKSFQPMPFHDETAAYQAHHPPHERAQWSEAR